MVYVLEKLENLKNSIYSIPFDRNDLSQLRQNARGLVASAFPVITQTAYTAKDYIWWFVNGYLWNIPEFLSKYGNRRLLDNPPQTLLNTIQDYTANMSGAQVITGFIGWVGFWTTIWGIKKVADRFRKPKEHR